MKVETHGEPLLLADIIAAVKTPGVRTLSQFAEDEIRLPTGPYEGLRFKLDRHPVARLLYAAMDSSQWHRVFITGPNQDGKSLLGFVIPTLYLLFERGETVIMGVPAGNMVRDKWRDDLLPAIAASRYREHLPTSGQGSRGGEINAIEFRNGSVLKFMTGGGDDQTRAAFTTPNVVVTETDGFDEVGSKSREGDKFSQLERRLLAYPENMRRLIAECTVSTETGRTWQEIHHGTNSRICIPCPHCSKWVTPDREHLTGWQEAENEEQAIAGTSLVCPKCGGVWTNDQRIASNARAVLAHKGQEVADDGTVIGPMPATKTLGFRWSVVNSVLNPHRLASVGGLEWKAKRATDEESAERDLCQSQWARPTASAKTNLSALEYMAIMRRVRSQVGRGICPPGTQRITVGIDIGKFLLHYVVLAWIDAKTPHVIDYSVQEAPTDSLGESVAIKVALQSLRDELAAGWKHGDGTMRSSFQFVDARYQTDIIREFCQNTGPETWWPTMGFGATQRRVGENRRETGARVAGVGEDYSLIQEVGGAQYFEINSDKWKSRLHECLKIPANHPGGLTLFDSANHMTYAKHLCAEQKVEEYVPGTGTVTRWEQVSRNNHYLDATVLAMVAANLAFLTAAPKQPKPPTQDNTISPTDWLNRHR